MFKNIKYSILWIALFSIVPQLLTAQVNTNYTYTYDNLNRLEQVLYDNGTTIKYSYDELGNRTCYQVTGNSNDQTDLTPTNGTLSTNTIGAGSSAVLTFNSENIGTAIAGASNSLIVLSTNASYEAGTDNILRTIFTPSIGAGGVEVISEDITIPATTPIGNYYLFVILDTDGIVHELSESNNIVAVPITVSDCAGLAVNVTNNDASCNQANGNAAATATGGAGNYSYTWSTIPSQTGSSIANLSVGNYTVTVEDSNGCQDTTPFSITSIATMPTANFSYTTNDLTINFSNDSNNGTSYNWDFGDTNSSTLSNPNHTYTVDGTYTVCLNTNNSCGTTQYCQMITISNSSCSIPSGLSVSELTSTTAQLGWNSIGEATGYMIRYRETGTMSWSTLINTTTPTYTLSNLTTGTPYEFQVTATCDNGISNFSNLSYFYTTPLSNNNSGQYFLKRFYNINFGAINSGYKLMELADGDLLILGGDDLTFGEGKLHKVDQSGNSIWSLNFEDDQITKAVDVHQLSDNSILVGFATSSDNYSSKQSLLLFKISNSGNVIWKKRSEFISSYGNRIGFDIDTNEDILITYSSDLGQASYYNIVKFNADLTNVLWSKRYSNIGVRKSSIVTFLKINSENEIVIGGSFDSKFFLSKFNINGNKIWERVFSQGITDHLKINDISFGADGSIYYLGLVDKNSTTHCTYGKLNAQGNEIWTGSYLNFEPCSITSDQNSLYFTGFSRASTSQFDAAIVKTDLQGNLGEQYVFDDPQSNFSDLITIGNNIFVTGKSRFSAEGVGNGFAVTLLRYEKDLIDMDLNCENINDIHELTNLSGSLANNTYNLAEEEPIIGAFTNSDVVVQSFNSNTLISCGEECQITAGITVNKDVVCANELLNFYYSGTNATNFEWTLGNNSTPFSTQANASYTFEASGSYTINLKVSDGATCQEETSIQVTVLPQPSGNVTTTAEQCNRQDGTASLNIQNGTSPYNISWSTGANQVTNINNLSAGNYSVLIEDVNNCSGEVIPFSISNTSEGFDLFGTVTDISCNGLIDGAISTSTNGTVGTLNYIWSNNATSNNIIGLATGDYALTLSDAAGCEETKVFSVAEPAVLTLAINSTDETYCGFDNGTANITVTGGTPSFQYNWQDNQTTSTAIGLSQGNYTVTVTDENNCTATTTATIDCEELVCESVILIPISNQVMDNDCSDGSNQRTWDFAWTACPYATKYHLYVRSVTNSIIILNNPNIVDTFASFPDVDIFNQTAPFEVKVKAFVNGDWKDWSPTIAFDLEPVDTDCPCSTIVTNTNDNGIGSLRAAIDCANNDSTMDTISFDLSGTPPFIIQPTTKLPALTDNGIIIDATTQTAYTIGDIIIDGSLIDTGISDDDGIEIKANNIAIYGLHLKKFTPGDAIEIGYNISGARIGSETKGNIITESRTAIFFCCAGGSDITIEGNYIGTNPAGADLGNTWDGINLQGAGNSIIRKNTITYNNRYGVILQLETGVQITENEFYCNQTPIFLNNANNNKLPPIIQLANDYTITGTSEAGDTIEIFSTSSTCLNATCQGKNYLGTALTNANGDWTLTTSSILVGTKITATATDDNANTSSFANCYTVPDVCADVEFVSISITQRTSTSLSFSYSFNNKGTGIANLDGPTSAEFDNVSIQTFVSTDNIYGNANDVPSGGSIIDLSPIGNLSTNQNYNGNFTAYKDVDNFNYLIILLDWGDVITECDETNNIHIIPLNEDDCDGIHLTLNEQPINDGTYQAEETITSTAFIQAGANVIFEAGQSILLEAGFEAISNSTFLASIEDCSETAALQQTPIKAKTNRIPIEHPTLQITPNPFQESTIIEYSLPDATMLSINLFDLNGQLIRSLENKFQERGNYSKYLVKSNLEVGFYIVQLKTNSTTISKKIILVE